MAARAEEIVSMVEKLASPHLAESWDNSGWQVGNPHREIKKVMVALDVDEQTVEETVKEGAQLIVCHHPLIMKGLKSIRLDKFSGRILGRLVTAGIDVYAAHTNLDSAGGGINDILGRKLGLRDMQVIHVVDKERYFKLVVFVPPSHLENVMGALRDEGAGWIGNYSDCTYQLKGIGTFRPGEGTDPFIGSAGDLETVEEIRLETIVPEAKAGPVVEAMVKAHPYEEVAYDLYPLALEGPAKGLGRVGNLPSPVNFVDFIELVKKSLEIPSVRYGGKGGDTVERVAVCGGSGAELWPMALARGAQVLVTGDVKYHTAKDMLAGGIKFIDAGHHGTEKICVQSLSDYLRQQIREKNMDVEVLTAESSPDPFQIG